MFTEKYTNAGGFFGKLTGANGGQWKEGKTDSSAAFYFEEVKRDNEVILLRGASRKFRIELPIKDGMSRLSPDDGVKWQDLYEVRKDAAECNLKPGGATK